MRDGLHTGYAVCVLAHPSPLLATLHPDAGVFTLVNVLTGTPGTRLRVVDPLTRLVVATADA